MRKLFCLALLAAGVWNCSESVKPTDLKCSKNEDCLTGKLCNPQGKCVTATALSVKNTPLSDAMVGTDYFFGLQAEGGIQPYRWSLSIKSGGEFLSWLEIDSQSGILRNKTGQQPQARGAGKIEVTVTDNSNAGKGASASQLFDLRVIECTWHKECYYSSSGVCYLGLIPCTDGVWGKCSPLSPPQTSLSADHCGADCSSCPEGRADGCLNGACRCGDAPMCEPAKTCCNGLCVDFETDTANCGGCGKDCAGVVKNADGIKCSSGKCDYVACKAGFYDCDGDRSNGCEQKSDNSHCSGCADDCASESLYPNTQNGRCSNLQCAFDCLSGYADCNDSSGCETDITRPQTCGSCNNNCVGTTNPACISDGGALRCGCRDNTDCKSSELCCGNYCVPRNAEHCTACDKPCTIGEGGLYCIEGSNGWSCECNTHTDCKGPYDFSVALCDTAGLKHCYCGTTSNNCQGTVNDICCSVSGGPGCTDLSLDPKNCGICGRVCAGQNTCEGGACRCNSTGDCQATGEAWKCVNNLCVCTNYHGTSDDDPCPPGQLCCSGKGCCVNTRHLATFSCSDAIENSDCSDGCFINDPNNIWCFWGCCDKTRCASEADCERNRPADWPY